jgi:hypothetical protein
VPHLHKFAIALIIAGVVVGFLAPPDRHTGRLRPARQVAGPGGRPQPSWAGAPGREGPPFDRVKAARAARAAGANELGEVPVLAVHRVTDAPRTSLDRTPAELHDEFAGLARQGYVPVTASEFAGGRMKIPAGRHPVVLTFDGASLTAAAFDAKGNPRPDSAAGVVRQVAREVRGFRPVATFFMDKDTPPDKGPTPGGREPATSGDSTEKPAAERPAAEGGAAPAAALRRLADHGFEVIGRTGGRAELADRFQPGWKPAESPYGKDFDASRIPRIRDAEKIKEGDCMLFCSAAWIEWLAGHPDKRYTSDGNPATVAFPRDKMISLAPRYKDWACPY